MYKIKATEEGQETVLRYTQDVEPVLNAAADARREDRERGAFQKTYDMKRTAIIPFVVLMEIERKYGLNYTNSDDAKVISKILKGPDYAKFRTTDKLRR